MNQIKWIARFIVLLLSVMCKSYPVVYGATNYTFYYRAHHYEFNLTTIMNTPCNEAIIDEHNLYITRLNSTTSLLSFMIHDNITLDFFHSTNFDQLSYKYATSSASKRRLTATESKSKSKISKSEPRSKEKTEGELVSEQQRALHKEHIAKNRAQLQEHMADLKHQLLEEMRKGFDENNKKSVLLKKIDDIKHQQTELALQHKLLETRKKQKREIAKEKNEMMERQMRWEQERENERQQLLKKRKRMVRKRHEMRLTEHDQLMNGLKAFLMTFSQLMKDKRAKDYKVAKRKAKQINDEIFRREKEIEERIRKQHEEMYRERGLMFQGFNQQLPPPVPPPTRPPRPPPPPPPPLLPPIPPVPRRLQMVDASEETMAFEIDKCVLDGIFGSEICIGYNMQNEMVSLDVISFERKERKSGVYGNIDPMMMDTTHTTQDIVYLYAFDVGAVGRCMDSGNSTLVAAPFGACVKGREDHHNNMDGVMIYLERYQNEIWMDFVQRLDKLRFEWTNDEQWDVIITFDGNDKHVRVTKCVYLGVITLCVDNVAVDLFEIQLKIPFND